MPAIPGDTFYKQKIQQKMKTKLQRFVERFSQNSDRGLKGGFASIRGGLAMMLPTTNSSDCSNPGTCSGTNEDKCSNTGDCSHATNKIPSNCTNSATACAS